MNQANSPVTYDKHDEDGQFTPTYDPEAFLEAVEALDLPTTSDIADHVGCAHRTALHHLNALEEDAEIDSRMAGRAKLWTPTEPPTPEARDAAPLSGSGLDDVLDGWHPDTEANAEAARTQTRRAAEYLQDEGGRHSRSDFIDALAGDSSLGNRSWWERAVQPGLRRLAEAGLVEYREGYHDYRWSG